MSLGIRVADSSTAGLERARVRLRPGYLTRIAAGAVAGKLKDNFQDLQQSRPNRKGWKRQNFWASARRSINVAAASGDTYLVSVNKPGIALLYFGGVVRPVLAEMLTIPAAPEAYGKRAREFPDLVLDRRVNPDTGKMQLCLVRSKQTTVRLGPKRKDGTRRFKGKESEVKVMYWLAKKATIRKDASILPTDAELESAATKAIESKLTRLDAPA